MREYNLLGGYPQPDKPRYVSPDLRNIHNRIKASYRDIDYYDGDRNCGYGGFKYDGRWQPVAKKVIQEYQLNETSAILQIGCEKGFLLHDLHELHPSLKLVGHEMSEYAIKHSMNSIQNKINHGNYETLPYADNEFDFVIAIGVIYPLTLAGAINCLKEIQRVGKGKSFITLGSFRNTEEERLFRMWSVLGATILHENDWKEVLKHVGYTGDYTFVGAKTLNLKEKI